MGIFASGSPALASEGAPMIALYGQVVGALVMAALGFVPGYLVSLALGLDQAKIPAIGARG